MKNDRRKFLLNATKAGCFVFCSGMLAELIPGCDSVESGQPVLNVAEIPALQTPGGAIKKTYSSLNNSKPIFIIRRSEKEFVVYSAICTHQEAELRLPKNGVIICPNHGSKFSVATGEVLDGRAYAPLPKFQVQFDRTTNILKIGEKKI
jgi:Rieske Fe-S protein